jgi:hypothetical protein
LQAASLASLMIIKILVPSRVILIDFVITNQGQDEERGRLSRGMKVPSPSVIRRVAHLPSQARLANSFPFEVFLHLSSTPKNPRDSCPLGHCECAKGSAMRALDELRTLLLRRLPFLPRPTHNPAEECSFGLFQSLRFRAPIDETAAVTVLEGSEEFEALPCLPRLQCRGWAIHRWIRCDHCTINILD